MVLKLFNLTYPIYPYVSKCTLHVCLNYKHSFLIQVLDPRNEVSNEYIRSLAYGPITQVTTYNGYIVNGYKFLTDSYGCDRSTSNSGVCIKGTNYSASSNDYYGILKEIVELEYLGEPIKKIFLFNCEWYDSTLNRGMNIDKKYKLIEVSTRR